MYKYSNSRSLLKLRSRNKNGADNNLENKYFLEIIPNIKIGKD